MKINIVIIGLGNIGKRHLQAVEKLSNLETLYCYDLYQEQIASTKTFISDNSLNFKDLRSLTSLNEVKQAVNSQTFIIVATTVKDRFEILNLIIPLHPMAILAEKALCSSKEEYDVLIKLADDMKVPVLVNLSRRQWPFYQNLKSLFNENKIIGFKAVFPGGVGCSGIHIFDLLFWLSNGGSFELLNSWNTKVYETKRVGYSDVSSNISVIIDDAFEASFNISKEDDCCFLEFLAEGQQIKIFEIGKKVYTFNNEGLIKEESFDIPFTSQLTDKIISNFLNGAPAGVPTIKEAYLSHSLLFKFFTDNNIKINFT